MAVAQSYNSIQEDGDGNYSGFRRRFLLPLSGVRAWV